MLPRGFYLVRTFRSSPQLSATARPRRRRRSRYAAKRSSSLVERRYSHETGCTFKINFGNKEFSFQAKIIPKHGAYPVREGDVKSYVKEAKSYLAEALNASKSAIVSASHLRFPSQMTSSLDDNSRLTSQKELQNTQLATESDKVDEEFSTPLTRASDLGTMVIVAVASQPKGFVKNVTAATGVFASSVASWEIFKNSPEFSKICSVASGIAKESKPYLIKAKKAGNISWVTVKFIPPDIPDEIKCAIAGFIGPATTWKAFGAGMESSKIIGVVGGAVGGITGATIGQYFGGVYGSTIGGALGGAAVQAVESILQKTNGVSATAAKEKKEGKN